MNYRSKIFKELSLQEIREIIELNFGKFANIEITPLKGGLFNTTYKITLHSPNHELILRVGPANRQYLLPFEHNLMIGEADVYDLLSKNNVPCPTVLKCDSTKSIIDRDYMITEYINSIPLSDETIPEELKTEVYEQIGKWTAIMHSIVGTKFGRASQMQQNGGYDSWASFLIVQANEIGEKCLEYDVFDKNLIERVIRLFEDNSWLYEKIEVPKLIHADLWVGNVLVRLDTITDKYELVAIIDADRALFGDIDFEFASPWIINEPFLKGYGENYKITDDTIELKKDTYKLIYSFIDAFVWKVQYNDMTEYENNKRQTIEMLGIIEAKIQNTINLNSKNVSKSH